MARKWKYRRHNPNDIIKPVPPDKLERILHGDTLPDMQTKARLAETRKGTLIMPSLQDALQTAIQKQTTNVLHATINEWSKDEQEKAMPNHTPVVKLTRQADGHVRFVESTGVSRAVHKYLREHPGCLHTEVVEALVKAGFAKLSASSLITQGIRAKIYARDENNGLTALYAEYRPIPSAATLRRAEAAAKAAKAAKAKAVAQKRAERKDKMAKAEAGIAALAAVGAPAITQAPPVAPILPVAPVVTAFSAQSVLENLPIKQARELYDELKKIFGG